ncbi:hypothetical protein GcM1_146010 [Golovinomyces cichoracearum]|uniref:Uncharacterized protein n=1 Tax=Golovinomyces cichoracearum TaxID=62708 RepID=A0A420JB84_9PEZI|nr:hypothetical protein GcM1_146010 [Golovinomyces cichoracearum]
MSNSARKISIIWLPCANKVIASRDDVKNPEIVPSFEDCTTTFEHGDRPAINPLVEDLIENKAH